MVEPTGFYVSTNDIHDDSKWSDAVYFEELGFDQDVSRPSSSPPNFNLNLDSVRSFFPVTTSQLISKSFFPFFFLG
jgi:hypothetical protein